MVIHSLKPRPPLRKPRLFTPLPLIVTAVLAVGLVPALRAAQIPVRFAWTQYFTDFWVMLPIESLMCAGALYLIACNSEFRAWLNQPRSKAPVRVDLRRALRRILFILLPMAYLFCAFVLVFGYDDVIAALRFDGNADALLNRWDALLLGGATIPSMVHSLHMPVVVFTAAQWIYFVLFAQIGSCILFLSLGPQPGQALRLVETLAMCYYLAIGLFFLLPATGPYYLDRSAVFHGGIYQVQQNVVHTLDLLRAHQRPEQIGLDYFIAFPSMHIAQPVILLYFMRKRRKLLWWLAAFDVLLIPAILLLEQHYLVDLLGGVGVALLAVGLLKYSPAWFSRPVQVNPIRQNVADGYRDLLPRQY
jgi:hypothetical protein